MYEFIEAFSVFTQFDHNISEAVTTPVWKATTLNLNTSVSVLSSRYGRCLLRVESQCYLQVNQLYRGT
ncbi:hypothetical protein P8452_13091 [Trifolium repens]|nr:hypothetical protein P8452_13091 [Trifolium repens]